MKQVSATTSLPTYLSNFFQCFYCVAQLLVGRPNLDFLDRIVWESFLKRDISPVFRYIFGGLILIFVGSNLPQEGVNN